MEKLLMLPGPTNVSPRVMEALSRPVINHRGAEFHRFYEQLIEKAKKLFTTEGDVVILSSSGTGGVEAAVQNLIRPGDKAVVPVFGEFSERLADLLESVGGRPVRVPAPYGDAPSIAEIEDAFRRNKDAKALFVVYNETSTGVAFRQVKQAGEIASANGAFFVVDAISNFAGDDLPVDHYGVDICITGSQKCLAAPPGLALLSISRRARSSIEENRGSSLYFDISRYLTYLERKETPFTPCLPLFYALDEAINMVFEEGLANRIARHKRCSNALYEAFEILGLQLFAKRQVRSTTVIAVEQPENVSGKQFRETLDEKFGISVAGGFAELSAKLFRVGCMGLVNREHVLSTLAAISSALSMLGFENPKEAALGAAEEKLKGL